MVFLTSVLDKGKLEENVESIHYKNVLVEFCLHWTFRHLFESEVFMGPDFDCLLLEKMNRLSHIYIISHHDNTKHPHQIKIKCPNQYASYFLLSFFLDYYHNDFPLNSRFPS